MNLRCVKLRRKQSGGKLEKIKRGWMTWNKFSLTWPIMWSKVLAKASGSCCLETKAPEFCPSPSLSLSFSLLSSKFVSFEVASCETGLMKVGKWKREKKTEKNRIRSSCAGAVARVVTHSWYRYYSTYYYDTSNLFSSLVSNTIRHVVITFAKNVIWDSWHICNKIIWKNWKSDSPKHDSLSYIWLVWEHNLKQASIFTISHI